MAQPGSRDSTTDWVSRMREATPWLDRVGSLVAAGLTIFAAVSWWFLARDLTHPCRTEQLSQAVCDEVPEILQGLQAVLAIAGVVAAALVAVLTLFQAVSGRRVPRLRTLVAILAALAAAWGLVFVIGWWFF